MYIYNFCNLYIPHGVVGNISACHADARGSIPRGEVFYFDKYTVKADNVRCPCISVQNYVDVFHTQLPP